MDPELLGHMAQLHNTMVPLGATPREYMAFVDLYSKIYSSKRSQVSHTLSALVMPALILPISSLEFALLTLDLKALERVCGKLLCRFWSSRSS